MAFKNVVITKELDEKYKLSKIFNIYNRRYQTIPEGTEILLDSDKECFLLECYHYEDPELNHFYLSKAVYMMWYQNTFIELVIDYDFYEMIEGVMYDYIYEILDIKVLDATTKDNKEGFNVISYDYICSVLDIREKSPLSKDEIFSVVKDALLACKGYGEKVYVLDEITKQKLERTKLSLDEANEILDIAGDTRYFDYVAKHLDLRYLGVFNKYTIFCEGVNDIKDTRSIDKTIALKFLDIDTNTSLKNAFMRVFDIDEQSLLKTLKSDMFKHVNIYDEFSSRLNKELHDTKEYKACVEFEVMHITILRRFVKETSGAVRVIVGDNPSYNFVHAVCGEIMKNENITMINDIPKKFYHRYAWYYEDLLDAFRREKDFFKEHVKETELLLKQLSIHQKYGMRGFKAFRFFYKYYDKAFRFFNKYYNPFMKVVIFGLQLACVYFVVRLVIVLLKIFGLI